LILAEQCRKRGDAARVGRPTRELSRKLCTPVSHHVRSMSIKARKSLRRSARDIGLLNYFASSSALSPHMSTHCGALTRTLVSVRSEPPRWPANPISIVPPALNRAGAPRTRDCANLHGRPGLTREPRAQARDPPDTRRGSNNGPGRQYTADHVLTNDERRSGRVHLAPPSSGSCRATAPERSSGT